MILFFFILNNFILIIILVKYSEHSDKSNEPSDTRTNGSDNIELAQTRENITLVRNESEGFGFVIMSSPRFVCVL